MDFEFVRNIGKRAFSPDEIAVIRGSAPVGSHGDFILKESLIDPTYDKTHLAVAAQKVTADNNYILNSFPDEHFLNTNLLVRSEFLILRHVGASCLRFRDADAYVKATVDRLLTYKPAKLIYRLCDFNAEDFGFLDECDCSGTERGAQFLIEETRLLELDLAVIGALLCSGLEVRILIPFVRFPDQLHCLSNWITSHFASRFHRPPSIGVMLEVPANLFQVEAFAMADFFVPGPSDLTKYLFGGLDRNHKVYEKVTDQVLLEPLEGAICALDRLSGREIFFTKSLIELARQLDLSRFQNVIFRDLFVPFQLVRGASHGGLASGDCERLGAASSR